jgi:hypothetical protein
VITLAKIVGFTIRKIDEYIDRAYVAYLVARDPERYETPKKEVRP